MATGPNPQRHTDSVRGLLSKIFIVYPHNPQVYQWLPPTSTEELQAKCPQVSEDEILRMQMEEFRQRESKVKETIDNHNKLVRSFAEFLESHKIAVSYEGLLLDHPVSNYMKWFQDQMQDSDFILLVITESFRHFLNEDPPNGKEWIFSGEFLHNLIHAPKKKLLPIFLNRPVNLDLLPDALRSSSTYHIPATNCPPYFNVQQPQLDSLYAIFTKQNRIVPPLPPANPVPIVNLRGRCKFPSISGKKQASPCHF